MNENPKTLVYHRKALLSKGLMLKQVHHQKTKGQNFQGTLFHIPRLKSNTLDMDPICDIFLDYAHVKVIRTSHSLASTHVG